MTKFDELMHVITRNIVFVQTHNYPDQDALATAQGLKSLIERRGKQAIICYKGEIDKYNTIKMIELLKLDILPADSIDFRPEDEIILVDCQKGNINVKGYTGMVIGCIDHHKLQGTDDYKFHDIRPEIGSCSTIIAQYFLENNIELDELTATNLAYGIRMDTSILSRGVSDLDIDMYAHLYKLSNHETLRKLDSCSLKVKDLQAYYNAITNIKIYNNIGLVDIGNNCSESISGQIADFLLTLREIEFIVVHSYRDNGIKFSVRSDLPALDAAEIIKKALADCGDGGGHATMAAGFVPDVKSQSIAITISNLMEQRILEIIEELTKTPKKQTLKPKKLKHMITQFNLSDN